MADATPSLHHVVFCVRRANQDEVAAFWRDLGFEFVDIDLPDVGLRVMLDWDRGIEIIAPTEGAEATSQQRGLTMTFRVADLMLEPMVMAKGKGKGGKHPCTRCTVNTPCGPCSHCSECTVCTGCSACTCSRCTLTAASTCTGETNADDCSCNIRASGNLSALKAALRSKVQAAPLYA